MYVDRQEQSNPPTVIKGEYRMDEFEYKICVEYNDCSECPFGVSTGEYFTCGIGTKEQWLKEVNNDR